MSLTDLLRDALPIDDKHSSQTDALFLDQNSIVCSNTLICIAQQRDVNVPQPTLLSRYILPVPQRLFSIDIDKDDIAVSVLESTVTVLECEDFCRTDKTEGGRNKHNDQPRSFKI